jgi:hypothetical protein
MVPPLRFAKKSPEARHQRLALIREMPRTVSGSVIAISRIESVHLFSLAAWHNGEKNVTPFCRARWSIYEQIVHLSLYFTVKFDLGILMTSHGILWNTDYATWHTDYVAWLAAVEIIPWGRVSPFGHLSANLSVCNIG